jgi:hypothetical protein
MMHSENGNKQLLVEQDFQELCCRATLHEREPRTGRQWAGREAQESSFGAEPDLQGSNATHFGGFPARAGSSGVAGPLPGGF